ncbi:MraY family glycosyltransferase [Limibacillus halophilus]|uniref:UDP-N-acetylmuramyl pentapeptide phosphotransferase/UDP-N-acetylglucosamine-1-phosphate transferase n=1 Tax=Limibacillus halophilus TaxID=1579333 RepID=A0A839SPV8_9PROT|nr:glycosyltransferase family 4 protein [Limibacillus halophilus]MBB3063884.1 UDP-N-acetylmuramyl pentapeptide phosphotransferase/UDP-N-acetylglucosamine-1-phosphate transferase [Limibacillus halophilus]
MTWGAALLLALVVAGASWAAVGMLQKGLHRAGVLDHPNARSSHLVPTPRGAGIVLIPIVLLAWAFAGQLGPATLPVAVVLGALLLAAVSWVDDLRGLGALPRLLAQFLAIGLGLYALGPEGSVSGGFLPFWLDRLLLGLAWLWFVNLFNFMDGIDGISAVEGLCLCAGLLLLSFVSSLPFSPEPLLLAAALLGFAYWNRPPARIFLGDVGSVPLGFLFGFLLAEAALAGYAYAAIIIPAYYWADSTLTLLRRLYRRQVIWQGHREHWYQRAAARLGHGPVVLRILCFNIFLLLLLVPVALAEPWLNPWVAMSLAGFATLVFLTVIGRPFDA